MSIHFKSIIFILLLKFLDSSQLFSFQISKDKLNRWETADNPCMKLSMLHLFLAPLFNSFYFVVGVIIPGYKSFKAIETDEIQSHQRWISYWIVYSLLSLISIFERLATPSFLYMFVKAVLLVWLASDKYRGSLVVYNALVRPVLVTYASWIDTFFKNGTVVATQTSQRLMQSVKEKAQRSTHNLFKNE